MEDKMDIDKSTAMKFSFKKGSNSFSPRVPQGEPEWIDLKCQHALDDESEFFITLNLEKGIGQISFKDVCYHKKLTAAFGHAMRGGLTEEKVVDFLEREVNQPDEIMKIKAEEILERMVKMKIKGKKFKNN